MQTWCETGHPSPMPLHYDRIQLRPPPATMTLTPTRTCRRMRTHVQHDIHEH